MHRTPWPPPPPGSLPGASPRPGGARPVVAALWARGFATLWLVLTMLLGALPVAHAEGVNLTTFELAENEEGLQLTFSTKFELTRPVEDALLKGVPLIFVAEAQLKRERWYWRDSEVATATRSWRLAYQPLTRKYRVTFGGLNQNHETLADALASLSSAVHWKVADPGQIRGSGHYVEFKYELDTRQMPRPMQIGIAGQPEWTLRVERTRQLN